MSEQPHNKSPKSELFQDKPCESPEAVHYKMDSPEQWTAEIERLRGAVDAATREMGKYARQCGEQQAEIERLKAEVERLKEYEFMYKELCK